MTIPTIPKALVITLGLFTSIHPVSAQERDVCVTARVPEDFELPDGSRHPADRLSLCFVQALSPVAGIHRVVAGGRTVGLARSRRSLAESRDVTDPLVLFRRQPDGRLHLVGYVVRIDGRTWSYALADPPPEPEPQPGPLIAVLARRG